MTFAHRIALLILPSILLMELPAQAADVQVGTGLVCDTAQQVEQFIALYDGDAEAAVEAVNAEERNPTACALAAIVYVPGPPLATARKRVTMFQIVRVLVIGVVTPNGVRAVEPAYFFSVREVEEREA